MNDNNIHGLPDDEDDHEPSLEELDAVFVAAPQVTVLVWLSNIQERLKDFVDGVAHFGESHTEIEWLRAYSEWENEQD